MSSTRQTPQYLSHSLNTPAATAGRHGRRRHGRHHHHDHHSRQTSRCVPVSSLGDIRASCQARSDRCCGHEQTSCSSAVETWLEMHSIANNDNGKECFRLTQVSGAASVDGEDTDYTALCVNFSAHQCRCFGCARL